MNNQALLETTKGTVNTEPKTLPKVMYQVVTMDGAELLTYDELASKHTITGINKKTHNRIEIQGKPVIDGFCGPMYNGINKEGQLVVRYESYKAYEMYSS